MTLSSIFRRLFRRQPATLNTFKVKKTDLEKVRATLHRQMANELGMIWPQTRRKL